ncbi:MAG: DNA helicase PcrA [Actinobacteria bacterium]|uniref:DNA 3'-5' helicase n=1 Tax=freshwater metagenome TaxID=449393 RepID=A0A6J5Z609_9ZZZZ|nr:DNA helicase PcrA [Actinomycetota bacterium]
MPDELLSDLNPQQRQAVVHEGTPLLVVAGAGSGKTRVLTRRIAYLLGARQVSPGAILAITFTNKAAGEMKERVAEMVGNRARVMWVSTFHSACVRILRSESVRLGIKANFTIYDMQDSVRLMTLVSRDLGIDSKQFSSKYLLSQVSNLKNELIDHESAVSRAVSPQEQMVAQAYGEYQRRLTRAQAVDFDDIIGHTVALLQAFPDVAEHYHRKFRHVLVDEYQDTNHAQYVLIRELVGDGKDGVAPAELCVVGDADQSIYAFRGANIRNIVEFERDYTNATTVVLDQNYRSTQNILSSANAVIEKNPNRPPKNLWTDAGNGAKVTIYTATDEHHEADFIVRTVDTLCETENHQFKDFAIFYRTNNQSRSIEEVFIRRGIPYKVVGGTRFYERKEIKDALAYLRSISNPDDDVSVRRILNTPRRGIGDRAEESVEAFASRHRITFTQALERVAEIPGLATRSANALIEFSRMMTNLRTLDESGAGPAQILLAAMETSGYLKELEASKDPQDEVRVENIAELENVAREFEQQPPLDEDESERAITLSDFLERVSLVADSDQIPDVGEHQGVVTLMTIHTAKGLEFPCVFVTGLEDGVFPHQRALGSASELEEERRLAYVSMTRAKQRLYLTRAVARSTWGQANYNPESRFLAEIPENFVERVGEENAVRGFNAATTFERPPKRSEPVMVLNVGERVLHDKFGMGTVIATAGSNDNAEATIDFKSAGQKRLLLRYAPVEKL